MHKRSYTLLVGVILFASIGCQGKISHEVYGQALRETREAVAQAQDEVWRTVEARTDAWVQNDYEAYLSLHHERWRRFSMTTSELSSKDDVARFWQGMKDSEKTHSIKLTPIAVEVYASGSAAIAHYIMMETVEWTAETQRRASGRLMEKGRVYRVPARFSDVYVKEGDLWLYAGGYRDLTCDIMPESPFPCLDIPSAAQQSVPADDARRQPNLKGVQ